MSAEPVAKRTPYARAAGDYLAAGWSPIPFSINTKWPPPDGYTGAEGKLVTAADVTAWTRKERPKRCQAGNLSFVAGNIGLRMPEDIIGIDVDMYGEKEGKSSLAEAEERWGKLPPTWMSTSRSDGSGIRLFRVPKGLKWPGVIGKGIEVITWYHRYAIVMPSRHPDTDKMYFWVAPDGVRAQDEFPAPGDVSALPETWVEGLTSGTEWTAHAAVDMDDSEVREWIAERNGGEDGEPCSAMAVTLARFSREVREAGDDGGAHDLARSGAWALIGDAGCGHSGLTVALYKLRKVFMAAVGERRDERTAAGEWARIVVRGVQKVAAEGDPDPDDMCEMISVRPAGAKKRQGSTGLDFERDDIGNAQRLKVRIGDDVRFAAGLGGWQTWDGERWNLDDEGVLLVRHAMEMARDLKEEAEFIEEPRAKAEFLKFARASCNLGKLKAAVDSLRSLKGITVPAEVFDGNPRLIACSNGTIELMDVEPWVKFRPSAREDYCRLNTGVPYTPKEKHPVWESFLKTFLPRRETRDWVQRLVGYSLFGGNPSRLLVIVIGPTTSGKSFLVDALDAALGGYAGPFGLQMFRSKQSSDLNPELARALPRRFVYAEEASAEWHLHADEIKRLTSGGKAKARLPFARASIEAVPAFTPWMVANQAPTIDHADSALIRRLRFVEFPVSLHESKERTEYRSVVEGEARAAVLAWAVAGWGKYMQLGFEGLAVPTSAVEFNMDQRTQLNECEQFLAEVCEREATESALAGDLYSAYEMWCNTNGVPERDRKTSTGFGRYLTGVGIPNKRVKMDGKTVVVRLGIRLKTKASR